MTDKVNIDVPLENSADDLDFVQEVQISKWDILGAASDLAIKFAYYDRKEDENLPVGAIQKAIEAEVVTVDEIVEAFAKELKRKL
jgi:hypothetical protein